jgi:hypothetical protein
MPELCGYPPPAPADPAEALAGFAHGMQRPLGTIRNAAFLLTCYPAGVAVDQLLDVIEQQVGCLEDISEKLAALAQRGAAPGQAMPARRGRGLGEWSGNGVEALVGGASLPQ